MSELLFDVLTVAVAGAFTGFLVAKGTELLDFMMDYENYWWKLRYWIAKRYAKSVPGMTEKLELELEKAKMAIFEDKAAIMHSVYMELAAHKMMFKRWICTVCLSTYISLFGILIGGMMICNFYSLPSEKWILLIPYGISVITFTYFFINKE